MNGRITYTFSAAVWQHASPGGWFFVSLPAEMAREIRTNLSGEEEGWGRLKARAQIGNSSWETAIWYDTKHGTYLLALKTEIRRKENISAGKVVEVRVAL